MFYTDSNYSHYFQYQCSSRCDVLVCAIGHKPLLKDRMTIIKDLWAAGLKAELLLDIIQVFYIAIIHILKFLILK